MVKNLDTKEIWKFSKNFVKREGILLLACVLAVSSSLAVVPKAEYIDWRVLVLLYCLMLVVGGFKKRRVLDNCAVRLLQRCISLRQITAALLLITFISSMLVTNDVALITFVPLTLIIGKEAGVDVGKIIVWQTLAANLGSMLTPMGNPFVRVASRSGYLTPVTETFSQRSVSDSSDSDHPARGGSVSAPSVKK